MGGIKKRKQEKRLERRIRGYEETMKGGGKGQQDTTRHLHKPGSNKK